VPDARGLKPAYGQQAFDRESASRAFVLLASKEGRDFVGVVQAFQKLPFLSRLAPTQSEPPFFVAQLIVMAIFVVLGILAVMRFRPAATMPV